MPTPSNQIIQLLKPFRIAMTAPILQRMCILFQGAVLTNGARTVTSCLRAAGLSDAQDFASYHRVLNRARWSAMLCSRILLSMIVRTFLWQVERPIVLVIDDTLERRRGKKIIYKSIFRDAIRSTVEHVALCYGIRWLVVCVLVSVPWSTRKWALPFLAVPVLSEKRAQQLHKQYRSPTQWAQVLIQKIGSWYPERAIELVGDGGYACVGLAHTCKRQQIGFVSRLRLDAALYDRPAPQPKCKRGPKPKKGERQMSLSDRLLCKKSVWTSAKIGWYGQADKSIQYCTGTALWHKSGLEPVLIRWVLLRSQEAQFRPGAIFSTGIDNTPEQIIERFLSRWNIEVTFEEMRACLGFETQRHWSATAIGRTTPVLFALFSLVVILAKRRYPGKLPIQQTGWYHKQEATFRDVLGAVRSELWLKNNYTRSVSHPDHFLIPATLLRTMQNAVCYAT